VRDVDRGEAEAVLERLDLLAQLHAHLGVEVRQRLVEKESCGSIASARPSATRWRWPPESS
jgi:hypothetical protein